LPEPPTEQVDNPDQRIGEDISSFTKHCIDVFVVFVGAVLKLGSFVGVLLSISPSLTAFVVVYSLVGTLITTALFGERLKHLTFEGAKHEANFRSLSVCLFVLSFCFECKSERERNGRAETCGCVVRCVGHPVHMLLCGDVCAAECST